MGKGLLLPKQAQPTANKSKNKAAVVNKAALPKRKDAERVVYIILGFLKEDMQQASPKGSRQRHNEEQIQGRRSRVLHFAGAAVDPENHESQYEADTYKIDRGGQASWEHFSFLRPAYLKTPTATSH